MTRTYKELSEILAATRKREQEWKNEAVALVEAFRADLLMRLGGGMPPGMVSFCTYDQDLTLRQLPSVPAAGFVRWLENPSDSLGFSIRFSVGEPGSSDPDIHCEFRIRMKPLGKGRFEVTVNQHAPLTVQGDDTESRRCFVDFVIGNVEEKLQ